VQHNFRFLAVLAPLARRSAKSWLAKEAETREDVEGPPLDEFGGGAERPVGGMNEAQQAQGGIGERCKRLSEPGPLGVVPVFVPPAILEEVQAVLDLPVAANGGGELARGDPFRRATGHIVMGFVKRKSVIGGTYLVIEPDGDLTTREVQTLANILGIVQVDPYSAGFLFAPLFSVTSWAGRAAATLAKQVFNASKTSG